MKAPKKFGDWESIDKLGAGGQGEVYKVRKATPSEELRASFEEVLKVMTNPGEIPPRIQAFRTAIQKLATDLPEDLGALKTFTVPVTGDEAAKAIGRLEREIDALRSLEAPGILKLLDANGKQRWMVTEFHPGGTLGHHRKRYKGDALAALRAFRPLVAAVARLHQDDIVHRDIKPDNIFIADDGRLVLGDFGIVFFRDESGTRLTETFERVGSRDWMAPWVYTGRRLENVKPSFDVFPLGKVLWAMISGEAMLPHWCHKKPDYNLKGLFPDAADEMELVNSVLDRCIVEEESTCLSSANELLQCLDDVIGVLQRGGRMLKEDAPRPCRVCGKGRYMVRYGYEGAKDRALIVGDKPTIATRGLQNVIGDERYVQPMTVRMFACDICGHVEMFLFADGVRPPGWIPPNSGGA